jgi:ABC-type thiamin/hydroxymethylpyrimidine transport system permease subunit
MDMTYVEHQFGPYIQCSSSAMVTNNCVFHGALVMGKENLAAYAGNLLLSHCAIKVSAEHFIQGIKAEPIPVVFSYYSTGVESRLFKDALVNTYACMLPFKRMGLVRSWHSLPLVCTAL